MKMTRLKITVKTAMLLLLIMLPLKGQINQEELLEKFKNMTLEEILSEEVSIASHAPTPVREAPGIITVIKRDDIVNSGARDLEDLLNLLVPGFNFLTSEYGAVGASVRGIWAYEGKFLLLIDGTEMNEEGYSSVIFGNHFLLENIERIEIIRGPGSVMYGGYAGLGVINIITKSADNIRNTYAGILYGHFLKKYSQRNVFWGIARKYEELDFSFTGYFGEGILGEGDFHPYLITESTINSNSAHTDPLNLNLKLNYKNLSITGIYDRYKMNSEFPVSFDNFSLSARQKMDLTDELSLLLRLNFNYQLPWKLKHTGQLLTENRVIDTSFANNKIFRRFNPSLTINYNLNNKLILTGGFEKRWSKVTASPVNGYYELPLLNPETPNLATDILYAQVFANIENVNLTVGGRFEDSDKFGKSFVPRIAVTKVFGNLNLKAMFSQSYRTPSGRYYSTKLKPERGFNYEFEAGYQFGASSFITVNYFNFFYRNLIVISRDSLLQDSKYINSEKLGSRGIEIEYRRDSKLLDVRFNLGFYDIYENPGQLYAVPEETGMTLGNPKYKINLLFYYRPFNDITVSPGITYMGKRYGYVSGIIDMNNPFTVQENVLKTFNADFILNFTVNVENFLTDGLNLTAGVRNVLNRDTWYIQAFPGYLAPVPAETFNAFIRLNYEWFWD